MYSQRISLRQDFKPFENRTLVEAVHLISNSLVKRAAVSGSPSYAKLLRHIWGQSEYATIEVLAAKRKQTQLKRTRVVHHAQSAEPPKRRALQGKAELDAARDALVKILHHVAVDELSTSEHRLTQELLSNSTRIRSDALGRLWGIPKVIFEVTCFDTFITSVMDVQQIEDFYLQNIFNKSLDARVYNMLYWFENNLSLKEGQGHVYNHEESDEVARPRARSVSRQILGKVIKQLLTKRRAPLFENNMAIVIETVMYAMHPDRFIDRYSESCLRGAGFAGAIKSYEYSRSFTASLENLQLGKLNRLLKDIRAVKKLGGGGDVEESGSLLSLDAVKKYCTERETLTDRALYGVLKRYVTPSRGEGEEMREEDFTRMYLALVGSGTDHGLKYWFSILDEDGDGRIGVGDICHFYAERRVESEKRNGIILADAESLWIRLCAMCGVSAHSGGIGLNSLKELGREDREFIMCALLIRRVDDGNLINVAATVTAGAGGIPNL